MSKKLTKHFVIILIISLVMSVFAGCGTNEDEGTITKDNNNETNQEDKSKDIEKEAQNESQEPITLKFLSYSRADFPYSNEMPVFKELEKRTNVTLEWELLPATEALQKLNLIMTSGSLPDMISYGDRSVLNKYGLEGAFIPLNDLIDEHMPNLKKTMEAPPFPMPNIKAEMKAIDGNIYAIPFLTATTVGPNFNIREDWLSNLNLEVPETTDELYEVLKAFKEKDPNGNNENDEIPYGAQGIGNMTIFVNSFGGRQGFYVDKDETIKYGPIEDAYKEGLEYCIKLINEGLIDSEFLSINTDQWRTKVGNNEIGFMFAWPFSGLGAANTLVQKLDPNYKYIPILPMEGPHGDRLKDGPQNSVLARTVITKDNKYPVETAQFLDYLFSEEGAMLMNWGIEGEHYKIVEGKPQFTDLILNNPEGTDVATARGQAGMQMALPTIASMEPEAAAADPLVAEAWKIHLESGVVPDPFPSLPLTESELADVNSKLAEINTYVDESVAKFLLGEESLDGFPKFVETIEKMGVSDVLKIYNNAYVKYKEMNE